MFTIGLQIKFLSLIINGLTLVEYCCLSSADSRNRVDNCISETQSCSFVVDGKDICYRLCSNYQLSWNNASKICANHDYTLPVIRNKKEQESLESYLKSRDIILGAVWASGRKVTHDQWTWLNGRHFEGLIVNESSNTGHNTHAILKKNQSSLQFKQENPLHGSWYMCQYRGTSCNRNHVVKLTNSCVIPSNESLSWYGARNVCLDGGGDLAVLSDEDVKILESHPTAFVNPSGGGTKHYWIGLGKISWQWKFLNKKSEDVKYSKWSKSTFPLDSDLCISIQMSSGEWRASKCDERLIHSVICQNKRNRSPGSTPISRISTLNPMASSSYANNPSESTAGKGRNISTSAIPISTILTNAQTKSYSSTLSSTVRESTVRNVSTCASPTSQTSTSGPVVSSRSTNNPKESNDVTTRSESTVNNLVVFAMIGVGVLLICICIFIFIFLLIRRRQKGAKEIGSSKANTIHLNNESDPDERPTKKSPETTTTSEDEVRGVYAEISPAKNSSMNLENAPSSNNPHQPSGTVYASLEFKEHATIYAEPVKKSKAANGQTQKVGPLGDIYSVPTPKHRV